MAAETRARLKREGIGPRSRLPGAVRRVGGALAALLLCLPATATELRWQAAESDVDRALANYLADSNIVSDVLMLATRNLRRDPPLELSIGTGIAGSRVPSYSAAESRIRLPYGYLEDAIRAQATLGGDRLDDGFSVPDDAPEEGQAVRAALDMLEYTLFHLLGHALVDDADPAADAAAEAVSSWLMIRGWPNGAAQWVEASRAFAAASQRLDGSLDEYWHAHALYALRERTLACWALGADPQSVEPLLPAVADPAERRRRCALSWQRVDAQVRSMLDPVLQPDAPLRHVGD